MQLLKKRDALLTVAKIATILVRIVLAICIAALGVVIAVIAFNGGIPPEAITVEIEPASLGELGGASALMLAIAMVALGLIYVFVTYLARIIDTVGEGDPFTSENAVRLWRMGWLAIIVQLISLPATLLATWLESHVDQGSFEVNTDLSFTGIGLAIVLFILARVFARGAEMREELEGTV